MKVAQNTPADGTRPEAALHPVPVGVGIQIFDFSKLELFPIRKLSRKCQHYIEKIKRSRSGKK